ncbi:RdgB/HAM1 family non-canonical purine NTP pyrophosphatase [Plasmodium fragile]|uniref:RdgB/HAM1 family non-canonical purine NTP pyrophosphatase n=1 Tax=Plasmodium fragile TaxID=5857 RepID=A0A0D9QLG5_PLAFR|nr:RdgB/HAM1 family non-canonical purine NTP pyrophosphatase [Plasmodium fragile]KJP87879.1 RdgB/HAM1 family non-canonical purine NTP pyrophosphatase [Plasmodium fragile]
MDIYLVTGNKHKRLEFQRHMNGELEVHFADVDLIEIQSNDIVKINEHKVKCAHEILSKDTSGESQARKKLVITDDTGLYMECLGSFPGPYIKWMHKSVGSQGIVDVATKFQNNKCYAICVYSVYDGKEVYSFEGVTQGTITGPRGSTDFGWDNIFSPEGCSKTFSEMSFEDKQESSPRFKAFLQLKARDVMFLTEDQDPEELKKEANEKARRRRQSFEDKQESSPRFKAFLQLKGTITGPRGSTDFGWDNIFSPEGCSKTFSEMSFEDKQESSPRFKAFLQLKARDVMFLTEDQDPEELKKEANEKWATGEAEEANALWRQALKECIKYSMRGFPTKKNTDMQLTLRLNLSLYHFKKKEFHECINQCDIILEGVADLDGLLNRYEVEVTQSEVTPMNGMAAPATLPAHTEETDASTREKKEQDTCVLRRDTLVKLFLRRAYSYLMLQEFEKCRENLQLVKRIDQGNAELMNLERKEQVERVDYAKRQKQLYRRMCNASGVLPESKGKG